MERVESRVNGGGAAAAAAAADFAVAVELVDAMMRDARQRAAEGALMLVNENWLDMESKEQQEMWEELRDHFAGKLVETRMRHTDAVAVPKLHQIPPNDDDMLAESMNNGFEYFCWSVVVYDMDDAWYDAWYAKCDAFMNPSV